MNAVGRSAPWQEVMQHAARVAATETTVLLEGESGTGKEVVARIIHETSPRRNGPFVAFNCAAMPDSLLESELFGNERGAFTGADRARPGYFEQAAGGVLFLDEVGELSASGQAKLLRVLQERQVQRLGSTRTLKTNVRVLAATNKDLAQAVERGVFREDLYYRLRVFDIQVPPLRERGDDILLLADAFLTDLRKTITPPPGSLISPAADTLRAYHWPGNVRQLHNVLERAAIVCDGEAILQRHLCLPQRRQVDSDATVLSSIERRMIEDVLIKSRWNRSKAAGKLGLTRSQLYTRLRKYDLNKPASFSA
jgi:Nif-specific regulatory protein